MTTDLDMTPRYAPTSVMTLKGVLPVTCSIVHPPGQHPKSPIGNDFTALELQTKNGSRWFGCQRAYINSELRMVVIGTPARDEVRMKWEVCRRP